MKILYDLLEINGVSGDESRTTRFLHEYVKKRKKNWKVIPTIFFSEEFHDCLLLKFGTPQTAVFAHIDTIGFMARYNNQLVPIGGPELIPGTWLVGEDSLGSIRCRLQGDEDGLFHDFPRGIEPGTCRRAEYRGARR